MSENQKKKKVVIIDDNTEILYLVERILKDTEFKVFKATDGKEGIRLAKEKKPDIVILDIHMPGFDGFITCKVIKRNVQTKDIPVIFLTGKKSKEDLKKAIQSGGVDYIVKPFQPSDLLTRIRRVTGASQIAGRKKGDAEDVGENQKEETTNGSPGKIASQRDSISIEHQGDVTIIKSYIRNFTIENIHIIQGIFANIIFDGWYKVVFDTSHIVQIDSAGLGLLISTNEALKSNGYELRLTFPEKSVNNRFTYIKINDLFKTYSTIHEAVESFTGVSEQEKDDGENELNVCLTCTFVNTPEARYCSYCGTNLMLGKGEEILKALSSVVSKKVIAEAQTRDIKNINKARNIIAEAYKIPSEFIVEILIDNTTITYTSKKSDSRKFRTEEIIGIQAPVIFNQKIQLVPETVVNLANPLVGLSTKYHTSIHEIDVENDILYVKYGEDAVSLHSQKNFSVALKVPLPITLAVPTIQHAGQRFKAQILELSRTRMIIFSEEPISVKKCMAVRFELPEGDVISSPLVFAQRGNQKFMYGIEFRLVDEKDSSLITQFMYKRQIELARGLDEM